MKFSLLLKTVQEVTRNANSKNKLLFHSNKGRLIRREGSDVVS